MAGIPQTYTTPTVTPAKSGKATKPTPSPAWNPKNNLQGGEFYTTDEVLKNAEQVSDLYTDRMSARKKGFKPSGSSPAKRADFVKKATSTPATVGSPAPSSATTAKPSSSVPVMGPPAPSSTTTAKPSSSVPVMGPPAPTTVTPPVQKKDSPAIKATVVADEDLLSNEDMSGKGYNLIGGKGGMKKWRKGAGISSANEKASNQTTKNVVTSPMLRDRPDAPRPFTTTYDMTKGRVVATGGTPDKEFVDYDKAQKNAQAGNATKEERDLVGSYATKDVLGRTQYEIDRVREDEKKGMYQAGRYVGPERNIDRNKKDYEAQQEKARFDAKVAENFAKAQKTGTYKFPTE